MRSRTLLSFAFLAGTVMLGCNTGVTIENDLGDGKGGLNGASAACTLGLVDAEAGWGELQISGLTASTTSTMDIARGSAGHASGRWYFEVTIDAMPAGVWWAQNVGVATREAIEGGLDTARMGALYNVRGTISSDMSTGEFIETEPFGAGDILGVATDLESGLVFFSRNGVWANGADPAAGTGGVEVLVAPGTTPYFPVLSISEGDTVTASFGDSGFAFQPPQGFGAFGDGFVVDAGGACADDPIKPATPAPIQATCGSNDLTSHRVSTQASSELHILGIYEPSATGTTDVHVARGGSLVLALSSYDPTHWNVTVEPGAQIERIVLSSYELSTVTAPAGIPVDKHVYEQNGDYLECAYRWPGSTGGCDTSGLVSSIEALTALPMTSFSGCYTGTSFTLTND